MGQASNGRAILCRIGVAGSWSGLRLLAGGSLRYDVRNAVGSWGVPLLRVRIRVLDVHGRPLAKRRPLFPAIDRPRATGNFHVHHGIEVAINEGKTRRPFYDDHGWRVFRGYHLFHDRTLIFQLKCCRQFGMSIRDEGYAYKRNPFGYFHCLPPPSLQPLSLDAGALGAKSTARPHSTVAR